MVAVNLIGTKAVKAGDEILIRKCEVGGASAHLAWDGLIGYVSNSTSCVPDGCIGAKELFDGCADSLRLRIAVVIGRTALGDVIEQATSEHEYDTTKVSPRGYEVFNSLRRLSSPNNIRRI